MSLRQVLDTAGDDITSLLESAAAQAGVDSVAVLALFIAEGGLNLQAERWGSETAAAKAAIAAQDWGTLDAIIGRNWPDISFGTTQQTVQTQSIGDRTSSVSNVLAVRETVFANPAVDLTNAAKRFATCIQSTADQTALAGMVCYNSGGDNINTAWYQQRYAGNLAAYQRALVTAEAYRGVPGEAAPPLTNTGGNAPPAPVQPVGLFDKAVAWVQANPIPIAVGVGGLGLLLIVAASSGESDGTAVPVRYRLA